MKRKEIKLQKGRKAYVNCSPFMFIQIYYNALNKNLLHDKQFVYSWFKESSINMGMPYLTISPLQQEIATKF